MFANPWPTGTMPGLSSTSCQPGMRAGTARRYAMPRRPENVAVSMFEPYAKYQTIAPGDSTSGPSVTGEAYYGPGEASAPLHARAACRYR